MPHQPRTNTIVAEIPKIIGATAQAMTNETVGAITIGTAVTGVVVAATQNLESFPAPPNAAPYLFGAAAVVPVAVATVGRRFENHQKGNFAAAAVDTSTFALTVAGVAAGVATLQPNVLTHLVSNVTVFGAAATVAVSSIGAAYRSRAQR